ncbi:MAG: hypothetical protein KJN63_10610 [Acidimicrobiia bacterium]|nr:hypothetical protein [Acidimicrobiia bacterium]
MAGSNVTWHRHVGDSNDTLQVELSKAFGDDLSAVTSVSATLENRITGVEQALSAAVSDSTLRVVTVTLGAWLTSTAVADDQHLVSLTVSLNDGKVVTVPENKRRRPLLEIE